MRGLIREGLAAAGILPPYERVLELNYQLRTELKRLLPIVQAQADGLNRGTVVWYSRQRVLDETRNVMADGLGSGLRSAALHVHTLARHCQWLADYAEEA